MRATRTAPLSALLLIAGLACGSGFVSSAVASDAGRLTIDEENDSFTSSDDRHYTQGLRFSYLSGDITPGGFWDSPFRVLSSISPVFQGGADSKRKIDWTVVGQSLFTPADLTLANPDPHDRPYAGWLYTGANLMEDRGGRSLDSLELLLGVVGPAAGGKLVQNDFHSFIQVSEAHGWSHQLRNEPGIMLSYDHKWRFAQPLISNLAVDAIPEAGATLGNVMTYGQIGAQIRLGQNLEADYGQPRIRPSLSGQWFDADRMTTRLGWYVYLGAQGRAVGRNIFLDGNSWLTSASVDKKPLVADVVYGASLFWTDKIKVDFTFTDRTKEFYGQKFPDRFGVITLSIIFW